MVYWGLVIIGLGAAIGAVAGMYSGKGALRGALSGANVFGNTLGAMGHLAEGNPARATGDMIGLGGVDQNRIAEGMQDYGDAKANDVGFYVYGLDDWDSPAVQREMSNDILGIGMTVAITGGVQYGGAKLMQLLSSGGMMFTMGRYAENLKDAVEKSGQGTIIVDRYSPVIGSRTVQTGDPDRHEEEELAETEEEYLISPGAEENYG